MQKTIQVKLVGLLSIGALAALPVSGMRQMARQSKPEANTHIHAVLLPGGVADATGRIGVFSAPEGGVNAVELATGHLLWHSEAISQPLFADSRRLIGQISDRQSPNGLRVVMLDIAHSGHLLRNSEPLLLPEWVRISGERGQRLLTSATLEKDALLFDWQATSSYAGGGRPPRDLEARMARFETGRFRIELKNGKVHRLAAPQPSVRFEPSPDSVTLSTRRYNRVEDPLPREPDGKPVRTRLVVTELSTGKKVWEIPIAGRKTEIRLP